MSRRIRGQEATIRIAVDGQTQRGSFFKVTDFNVTPRSEIVEEDFLGELESDLDFQHSGFDFNFSIHNQDQLPLNYLSDIVSREQNQLAHPDVTLTVIYAYRGEQGAQDQVEVYHDVFLKISEQGFGGRKEYITTGFEGKCKRRSQLPA